MPISKSSGHKSIPTNIVFKGRSKYFGDIEIKSDQKLNCSQILKYIVVLIDEHPNWKAQTSTFCSKFRRANGALMKICHHVP